MVADPKVAISARVSVRVQEMLQRVADANDSTLSSVLTEILEDALPIVEAMAVELEKSGRSPVGISAVMDAYVAMGRAHIERGTEILRAIGASRAAAEAFDDGLAAAQVAS